MILKNNLYNITSTEASEASAVFDIRLNPECFIYKAHFPGQPITPGVCVMQIAVELAETILKCKLEMVGVKNVKFLSVMSPVTNTEVSYIITLKTVEKSIVLVQAEAQTDGTVCAKMLLKCRR